MLLGKVIGTVWATRKDEGLVGMKFLIVREVDLDGRPLANYVVAADSVGAGEGETVLVAQGSPDRAHAEQARRRRDHGDRGPPRREA
jgi:microcompartment protein CcmK/EutM